MKVTKEFLHEKSACAEGLKFVFNHKLIGLEDVDFLNKLIEHDKLDWANWLIVRVMGRKQYLAYAIFAAEQVLENFERKYPTDLRPRKAIEAAKKILENDTEENRTAAAATAASSAAYSAAAYLAAAAATATAAYSAVYSAAAAAAAAAYSAATANSADLADLAAKEMRLKILQYGISLIQGA